jgi:trigger factor
VAENSRSYEPKTGKAADGDKVTIDYLGKVDGEAFRWRRRPGCGTGHWLEPLHPRLSKSNWLASRLATRRSSPFPSRTDYQAAHLAGKEATFDIKVKAVRRSGRTGDQ